MPSSVCQATSVVNYPNLVQGQADDNTDGARSVWDDAPRLWRSASRRQIKVVDDRLAVAGLRLAALLNDVFGHVSPQEFRY